MEPPSRDSPERLEKTKETSTRCTHEHAAAAAAVAAAAVAAAAPAAAAAAAAPTAPPVAAAAAAPAAAAPARVAAVDDDVLQGTVVGAPFGLALADTLRPTAHLAHPLPPLGSCTHPAPHAAAAASGDHAVCEAARMRQHLSAGLGCGAQPPPGHCSGVPSPPGSL
eukprot:scaffold26989_cov19-Tisochrysis_lutea.AAC.2